jgi:glyoxylase-like metal-dependent hydrolase (beta-lactamase superfamily II)
VFPLAEGLHLRFGADRVDVLFPGPSHAPDLVVVHLPDHDVLFGGCALLAGDRIGNRSDAAPLDVWAAAVRTLRDLPARHVIPGHGERTDRGLIEHTLKLLAAGR